MVQSRYAVVRSRCGRGAVEVRSRCSRCTLMMWLRYARGAVKVCLCASGTLTEAVLVLSCILTINFYLAVL